MIVLDASVLIGYLDDDDTQHEAAVAVLTAAVEEDLAVNPLTLAEVLVVPARDGRLDEAVHALRDLDIEEVGFPTDTALRLAGLRARTGLKMPDCCLLLTAEVTGARVASLDDRLQAAAERSGLPVFRGSG